MRYLIYFLLSQFQKELFFILILTFTSMHVVNGQASIMKSEFEGREAYTLQNSRMRISMLTGGGYIAELSLLSSDGKELVNPLFIPHYRTIDPHNFNPENHGDLYGLGKNAKLLAGYMGHYLCFPYFGEATSEFEDKLGYATHGEAYTVQYEVEEKKEDKGAVIVASGVLPLTKYSIKRSLSLLPEQSVILVEEVIENLERFDRPYQSVQHITFGKPFVEYGKTIIDAPVARIAFSEQRDDPLNLNAVQWPTVAIEGGDTINAGIFDSDMGEGGYRAWLMDPEREYTWFTIYNLELNLLVGYVFSKDENPWIGDWKENQHSMSLPRNGKTVAWGLEVGTTPFGSGVKRSIDRGHVFDTKTYRWIGAKEKIKQSYLIFLLEIDEDFKGVKGLKLEKGVILLTEKGSAKQIRIANGFTFKN